MNQWLIEELTWQSNVEKQHLVQNLHLLAEFNATSVKKTWFKRYALFLGTLMIVIGERIRRRYETPELIAYKMVTKYPAR